MPTLFDSYELTSVLTANASGSLHVAHDRQSQVLFLVLRGAHASQEVTRNRLLRESALLDQLKHVPGVIKLRSFLPGDHEDALLLHYFSGVNLTETLRQKPLDWPKALDWFAQIAAIVASVHHAGIVHRNLHPGAILVDPRSDEFLLTDFRLASPLADGQRTGTTDSVCDGAFLAPEQTGRINLVIDRRTDLYALGHLFHYLLAGEPAFAPRDLLEAVHSQLAKVVPRLQTCPPVLADIVAKLVSKSPEQRYQTVEGLLSDLERCREQAQKNGTPEPFPLGTDDLSDKLQVTGKLFGREEPTERLRTAFDRALDGGVETALLSGPSGAGKTSLARECETWVGAEGLFLSGKFDEFQKGQPYSAFLQLVDDVVEQILRSPNSELWRRRLTEALAANLSVVTALVPSFEALCGPLAPPPALPPRETENRLLYTMTTLFQTLHGEDRLLVVLLDDLQWIDPASARLLEHLRALASPRLLWLHAYRTDVGDHSESFAPLLASLEENPGVWQLKLQPLDAESVAGFIQDTVRGEVQGLDELVQALLTKTGGSPLFLNRLLRRIHHEGLLVFDRKRKIWTCRASDLRTLPASENVNDMLVRQLGALKGDALKLLQLAACAGSQVPLDLLERISEPGSNLIAALWPLIESQYLIPQSDLYLVLKTPQYSQGSARGLELNFRFSHDRIRQASYDSQSAEVRASHHLLIADLLEDSRPIDAAGHYLAAGPLDDERKTPVARLLLKAGQLSRNASAARQALVFFRNARILGAALSQDESDRLRLLLSETAYLCHEQGEAEAAAQELLGDLNSPSERAAVMLMQMESLTFLGLMGEAMERGTRATTLLGAPLKEKPAPAEVALLLVKVLAKAGRKPVSSLVNRQGPVPREVQTLLRAYGKFLVPAQMGGNTNLFVVSTLRAADLALSHNNCDETSGAFGNFAILLSVLGRHAQAFEFATLALKLEETHPNPKTGAAVHSAYTLFALGWNRPWSELPASAQRGSEVAVRYGDLFYIAFETLFGALFGPQATLAQATETLRTALEAIQATRQEGAWVGGMFALQRWRSLAGELADPLSLSEPGFDEAAQVAAWVEKKNHSGLAVYYTYKVDLALQYSEPDKAWRLWLESQPMQPSIRGSAYMEEYAVTTVHLTSEMAHRPSTRRKALSALNAEAKRLRGWARTCPANFEALATWAAAEAAIHQHPGRAARLMSLAVDQAGTRTSLRWRALILERAARWHLQTNARLGRYLLEDSYRLYARWGARQKLRALEAAFPDFGLTERTAGLSLDQADTESLWKVSQAISQERDINKLLAMVIPAILENAGARRGWLLMQHGTGWQAVARGEADGRTQVFAVPVASSAEGIPERIVAAAAKLDHGLLLTSAHEDPRFASDPLVEQRRVKSVLALRFSPGSMSRALWYLENDLVEGAFSPERLDSIRLLSSQVGISLENAQVYSRLTELNRNLEDEVQKRTKELEEKNRQFVHSVEYAAALQRSLLPGHWGPVADQFVLWMPRDIVSGDLYWFRETAESCTLGVLDCTGHGVSGAMITMLARAVLDDAWIKTPQGDLGGLLSLANQQFRIALGQDREGTESNEGFDVGLLWWNPQRTEQVKFAGARISLLHGSGGEATWIPGDRKSLGYRETPSTWKPAVISLACQTGDCFYLSSDGLLSQVGGEKSISFGRERLAKLVASVAQEPLANQGKILSEAFETYRRGRTQADDITILGVKLR